MSKKGENIRKRKDGCWEGRCQHGRNENGKILYTSIYGKTYHEAREKMCVALTSPTPRECCHLTSEISFSELLQQWQEANNVRLKGGTKIRYENLINAHILPWLGTLKLSEITAPIINKFLNEKLEHGRLDGSGGLSANYVRSISLVITSALNYAASEGLLQPLKTKIGKPSVVKKEKLVLSLEKQKQLEVLLKSDATPTCIGILISLYTGLRIGEICALQWDDINFDTHTIFVRHTISRVKATEGERRTTLILDEPKTLSSKRLVPIPSPLYSILTEYRPRSSSAYVVSHTDSFVSPRTYEARFHKVLKNCHFDDLNYHSLRHTFATRCIEVGVDVKSLSEILGHANVSITLNTYVHSSLEMKKNQLEKLTLLAV